MGGGRNPEGPLPAGADEIDVEAVLSSLLDASADRPFARPQYSKELAPCPTPPDGLLSLFFGKAGRSSVTESLGSLEQVFLSSGALLESPP